MGMNFFLREWVWDSETRPHPAPLPSLVAKKEYEKKKLTLRNVFQTYFIYFGNLVSEHNSCEFPKNYDVSILQLESRIRV